MTTIEITAVAEASVPRPGLAFWLCRYLPAEVAGTAALVLAGIGVTVWTDAPLVIALVGLVGESLGFFLVLAITIRFEHARSDGVARPKLTRFIAAQFGPAELIDTLAVRPVALILGVVLTSDPVVGLIAGKLAADVVFYTLALRGSARTARLEGAVR